MFYIITPPAVVKGTGPYVGGGTMHDMARIA